MTQNIVNWRDINSRSRKDLQALHPMMFSESGYLVPKNDGSIAKYDRDYVIFKLSRLLQPILSNNTVALHELLEEAAKARYDASGNRIDVLDDTENYEEIE